MSVPTVAQAKQLLVEASHLSPGLWVQHSIHVAEAAHVIMPPFRTTRKNEVIVIETEAFIHRLLPCRLSHVLNPYTQCDPRFDLPNAADIRLRNLHHYLTDHARARIALIGEAAGYNGCRFSGIPFMCEAQLLTWGDSRFAQSSLGQPRTEPSARAVWQAIGQRDDVILWNAFPWHPHQPGQPMSNRKPTMAELRPGIAVLQQFLDWLQPRRVMAVGRTAEQALAELGVNAAYVRHPSHGGATIFAQAMADMLTL